MKSRSRSLTYAQFATSAVSLGAPSRAGRPSTSLASSAVKISQSACPVGAATVAVAEAMGVADSLGEEDSTGGAVAGEAPFVEGSSLGEVPPPDEQPTRARESTTAA